VDGQIRSATTAATYWRAMLRAGYIQGLSGGVKEIADKLRNIREDLIKTRQRLNGEDIMPPRGWAVNRNRRLMNLLTNLYISWDPLRVASDPRPLTPSFMTWGIPYRRKVGR